MVPTVKLFDVNPYLKFCKSIMPLLEIKAIYFKRTYKNRNLKLFRFHLIAQLNREILIWKIK